MLDLLMNLPEILVFEVEVASGTPVTGSTLSAHTADPDKDGRCKELVLGEIDKDPNPTRPRPGPPSESPGSVSATPAPHPDATPTLGRAKRS